MSGSGAGPDGVSGNAFHGPVVLQTGAGSTQNVHHHHGSEPPTPLDASADELARAVWTQWQEEAGLRRLLEPPPLPPRWRVTGRDLSGPVGAATAKGRWARFEPLPGLAAVTQERLRAGGGLDDLHAVYGGLASGRLLLLGAPAVGKTATAVLLLLAALRHRARPDLSAKERARVPVPVLLTLDGWDPAREKPTEWAAQRLSREYTLFAGRGGRGRARQLLESGRVALFLDGLDEVDGNKLRGAMVTALAQAPCRLVLVSRALEAVLTAKRCARLGSAVALEIQPVEPAEAATYLLDQLPDPAPAAWRALTDRLLHAPDSAVARALAKPLTITLVRDIYADDGPVDELLDSARFDTSSEVENHLLDHAVTAAYTPRAGTPAPRWSAETAERTLRFVARRLAGEGDRDLRWWHITGWAEVRPRRLAMWALVSVVCGVPTSVVMWLASPTLSTVLLAVPGAVLGGWAAGDRFAELSDPQPLQSAGWRDIFTPGAIVSGVVEWLVLGTAATLSVPLLPGDNPPPAWLCFLTTLPLGYTGVLVTGRGHQIVAGVPFLSAGAGSWYDDVREHYNRPPLQDTRSVGPRDVWRHHLGLRLVLGLLTGVAVGLLAGPLVAWFLGSPLGALAAFSGALLTAVMAGPVCNTAVATAATALQLSAREGTPVRLMAFLEDARRRNLLRATGPVYQFRHARLQERLARPR
ncbi:hypothetical protein [Streptomyces sp. NPDC058145]|uniref:hypothetical protein n=1 Tax=Streptomyces sp. NPDC058145 TaxID=3346356 RepID=UPI0036EEB334